MTTFAEELRRVHEEVRISIGDEAFGALKRWVSEMVRDRVGADAMREGDMFPFDVVLPDASGAMCSLDQLLAEGPIVLVFYRGSWCPFCNLHLVGFEMLDAEFRRAGAQLVAVSPQTIDTSLETVQLGNLGYSVLSDLGNVLSRQLGLVFKAPENIKDVYRSIGIDFEAHNGDCSWEIPISATYVIHSSHRVVFSHVDVDYTNRVDPSEVLEVVKQQQELQKLDPGTP